MTYDPYQTFPTFGASSGLNNPFSSPYTAMQNPTGNPLANAGAWTAQPTGQFGNPGIQGVAGVPGVPNYGVGISPQQLQLANALATQSAQLLGLSPFINAAQNPFIGSGSHHHNPFAAAQNPLLNPILAQLASGVGQLQYSPYAQGYQQQPNQLGQAGQFSPYAQGYQQQPNQMGQAGQFSPYAQGYQQQQPNQMGQVGQFSPYAQGYQQQPNQMGQAGQFSPWAQGYQQQPNQMGQAGQFSPWAQGYQQQPNQMGQAGEFSPYGQFSPFNTPLAPQSWVGQGQQGQVGQFGGGQAQINPLLLQAVARAIQAQSNPWGTF